MRPLQPPKAYLYHGHAILPMPAPWPRGLLVVGGARTLTWSYDGPLTEAVLLQAQVLVQAMDQPGAPVPRWHAAEADVEAFIDAAIEACGRRFDRAEIEVLLGPDGRAR